MTFDNAIKTVIEYGQLGLSSDEIITIIEQLRSNYAPIVKMSKDDCDYYKSRTLLSGKTFNNNSQYYLDDVITIDRKTAIAILHPETIKVIDE